MRMVYLYYPLGRICIHRNDACSAIGKMNKENQRKIRIDPATISNELKKMLNNEYKFGSTPSSNDMWLEIDFNNNVFEEAVLKYIQTCYDWMADLKKDYHRCELDHK